MNNLEIAKDLMKEKISDIKYGLVFNSPEQLLENKIGDCFEQTELARHLFLKQNIPCDAYYISHSNCDYGTTWHDASMHTFLVFQNDGKFYWFEHAWGDEAGIHEFDSMKELLFAVKKMCEDFDEKKRGGRKKNCVLFKYDTPKFPLSRDEFINNYCVNGEFIDIEKL
ncbi:MAG: hypothetical protein FWE50_04850 [Alphaproteobacteria bacterium]|nr:hypothetical protein [Alphaproteobacteria bacterium]